MRRILFFFLLLLFVVGCSQEQSPNRYLNVTVREPVDRDWKDIKKEGVIRMITRYSSNTYFLHQGLAYGFEYELLKRFAQKHSLALEVVVMKPQHNPYDLLNSGKGDVIADNYAVTDIRDRVINFTHPYNMVAEVFVFSNDMEDIPKTLKEIARRKIPITVRRNSSYYHRLLALEKQGYVFNINLVSNKNHTEALLIDVAQGKYIATVADGNIFTAANSYLDHLVKGPILVRNDKIAWAVRENANRLEKKLNQYLSNHFRVEDGEIKRSAFLNILRDRYFNQGHRLEQYYDTESNVLLTSQISPYDSLFKQIADSAGIDWLMIAAIAAQESHFNPDAVGWSGAIGLLQVMPRYSSVDSAALYNPKINIQQGAQMLVDYLDYYSYIPMPDRWRFALAAYNAGQGHLADARRLAIDLNHNPNAWVYVKDAFLKLMERKYYQNARHGFCRGIITVKYVREVMNRYQTYQTVMALAASSKMM